MQLRPKPRAASAIFRNLSEIAENHRDVPERSTMELTLRAKTAALQQSIGSGTFEETALEHLDPFQYVQHNVGIHSGRAAILALHDTLPSESTRAHVVRAFQDGAYAFVHVDYHLFHPMVGFDVHRYDDGRAVEHWDNLQPTPPSRNPSGRSMIDGEVDIRDLPRTLENKTLVARYVEDVLVRRRTQAMNTYFDDDRLVQHDPTLGDGVSELRASLDGPDDDRTQYLALHRIFGEGNFVLAMCEAIVRTKHSAVYDLYRVSQGRIEEHWNVIEELLPREQWKNHNGKF